MACVEKCIHAHIYNNICSTYCIHLDSRTRIVRTSDDLTYFNQLCAFVLDGTPVIKSHSVRS